MDYIYSNTPLTTSGISKLTVMTFSNNKSITFDLLASNSLVIASISIFVSFSNSSKSFLAPQVYNIYIYIYIYIYKVPSLFHPYSVVPRPAEISLFLDSHGTSLPSFSVP